MFPIESRRPAPPGVARPPVDCPPPVAPDQLVVALSRRTARRVLELTGLHEQLATSPALADAVLAEAS